MGTSTRPVPVGAAPAAPAPVGPPGPRAAGDVVGQRDAVSGARAGDALTDGGHDTRGLVAEDGGQLGLDVPVGDVRAAHAAGLDAADDLAGPGRRVGELLDASLV